MNTLDFFRALHAVRLESTHCRMHAVCLESTHCRMHALIVAVRVVVFRLVDHTVSIEFFLSDRHVLFLTHVNGLVPSTRPHNVSTLSL